MTQSKPGAVRMRRPRETSKSRTDVMKDYAARQKERGYRQIKLWVPEALADWMQQAAEDARLMHEVGADPMKQLPKSILPVRKGA